MPAARTNQAFRFIQQPGPFRVVVMARSRRSAWAHVKQQATASLAWRTLAFLGEGHPADPTGWLAAVADRPARPAWMDEPVIWPVEPATPT